jgi:hypothetical protein
MDYVLCNFQVTAPRNNHPLGKNLANLVTLNVAQQQKKKKERKNGCKLFPIKHLNLYALAACT